MDDIFKKLRSNIDDCLTTKDVRTMKTKLKRLNIFANKKLKELALNEPDQDKSKYSESQDLCSMKKIAVFLNENIFSQNIKKIKAIDLFKQFQKWQKKDVNQALYKKSRFYRLMKKGRTVEYKHLIDGDYFLFKYNS